jgi:hypothetical protein
VWVWVGEGKSITTILSLAQPRRGTKTDTGFWKVFYIQDQFSGMFLSNFLSAGSLPSISILRLREDGWLGA